MNKLNMTNEIINIEGIEYVKYSFLKSKYNITADRVKKWRNGKGASIEYNLRYIQIHKHLYLYSIEDIETLINKTKN